MCRIATAASQACAKRYILLEPHLYSSYLRILGLHLPVALHNQVILRRTIYRNTFLLK